MGHVSVIGASGRVGRAIVHHLRQRHSVVPINRMEGEPLAVLAERAVLGVDVVVNAAGIAHVERPDTATVDRLTVANVDLPIAIAEAALGARCHMVHVSSVKASDDPPVTEYGLSKRDADRRLHDEFGTAFADAGLELVSVRPLALLFPPLDAGRVARLRWLRWWPSLLTPPVPLPVLAPSTFLGAIEEAIAAAGRNPGFRFLDFPSAQRGTLRDVRRAMIDAQREPAWSR